MKRHVFICGARSIDPDCAICGGKGRDHVHGDNDEARARIAKLAGAPITGEPTPLQREWAALKFAHPDHVIAVRLGDFYEFFFSDAVTVEKLLTLTLTKRNAIPMAGVPVHSWQRYRDQILAAGQGVAVADYAEGVKRRTITSIHAAESPTASCSPSFAFAASKSSPAIRSIRPRADQCARSA